jgi:multidrug efflux pump subunit AcrA (membrane-fusion protein)
MTLQDPPTAFRLGTTITVALTRPAEPRIYLPATALLSEGGRDSVWVVDGDGAHVTRRAVTVAERKAERVALKAGLNPGERVVVAGAHSLSEGQTVRLSDEAL